MALIAAANPSLVHIKFTNEDGSTVYKESYYPLGTTAKDIILPDATKASDEKYDYIFKGWSPTIKDATEGAVYTAVFEKVFKQFTVQYEFKSLTADKELPEEVTALLPKDPAGYGRDTDIKAIAPAKTEVKVDGGTWTFKGFDKDSKKSRDGKCRRRRKCEVHRNLGIYPKGSGPASIHRRHGNAPLHHCGRGPRDAGLLL